MRVLILEDDEATRCLFHEGLAALGHDVISFDTIKGALNDMRTSQIDLIIIDLFIGDTNSLGLAQYAGYAAPDAEIILVTGSAQFAHGEVLSDYPGINWILRKPLPLSDLEAFVSYAQERYVNKFAQAAS
jgi:DNA-binding response OmpR family regulator